MTSTGIEPPASLDRRLVTLLAIACGASVANLYYAQPLLDVIGRDLHVSSAVAGLLVTASQIGYATGLILLVPLGDLLDRRTMVTRLLLVCAAGLALAAAAPSFAVLAVALAIAGVTSVVAQVLVPLAGTLAGDHERGTVVGTVMSGLLLGILLARTVSGFVAELGGWRLVFVLAAVLMLALAAVLHRTLPTVARATDLRYGALLRSIGRLIAEEPLLRRRMVYGALGMASFSVFWTSIAFLLSGAPYHYGEATIGLFGLAGLFGAGAAQGAGRLADRGHTHAATGCLLLAIGVAWALLVGAPHSLAALIAGIVLLDLGIQGQNILNQSTIYTLRADARSRITTAYMSGNFVSGAIGSAAASVAWSAGGWGAVSALGGGLAVAGLTFWGLEHVRSPVGARAAAARSDASG
ncbi:MFS transporter [Baekduia soli]|uniref:MFS transporter n=1 Tax=Baekduia soli TaxID=496014 RepID=A0A5B8UAT9_9ACTN|nr:MFS transporter [Baekduia soli]QEC49918.1 MFS transporter [Baekduia soli]